MQNLKTGKEEIIYLLTKAIEKYKLETGQEIIQNTNRKNYESLAILLSSISNQLPLKQEEWGTDFYSPDQHQQLQEYPHRKYDITGGQIKDALSGIVSNPRSFLVDACYIYLYGKGRKAFKQNPVDENLLESTGEEKIQDARFTKQAAAIQLLQTQHRKKQKAFKLVAGLLLLVSVATLILFVYFFREKNKWQTIKQDMNLMPYQPTRAEIDSLEGVWLCYTGSPQARISDASRYHKVVPNIIDIQYKDGYFIYNRYGASFDHIGYMQFESPGIISVYSRIKTNSKLTESPRHSLLNLNASKKYLAAISASWNFDVGEKNKIIGIREIYIKLGKGGKIDEVINEIENASCQCKIIRWHKANAPVQTFYLKNQFLDSLPLNEIKPLINENSIILGIPQEGLIIGKDSMR